MNGYDNSVPFVNYKALESLIIEGEGIANEGLFSKMKEKREAKKAEKEAKKVEEKAKHEKFEKDSKIILNKCSSITKSIITKYKSKNPKLPFKPYYFTEDNEFYVEVYNDEWCMNEYDSKYIPGASDVFDKIYSEIEQEIEKQNFEYNVKVDIPENNFISILVEM